MLSLARGGLHLRLNMSTAGLHCLGIVRSAILPTIVQEAIARNAIGCANGLVLFSGAVQAAAGTTPAQERGAPIATHLMLMKLE